MQRSSSHLLQSLTEQRQHLRNKQDTVTNHKVDRVGVSDLERSCVFVFQELWRSGTIRVVIVSVFKAVTDTETHGNWIQMTVLQSIGTPELFHTVTATKNRQQMKMTVSTLFSTFWAQSWQQPVVLQAVRARRRGNGW